MKIKCQLIYCIFFLYLGFVSCNNFNKIEPIPAFINIDTAYVATIFDEQGTAAQHLTNVWVYDGSEPLGTYQLPAKIPILNEGEATIILQAGIKQNNRSDSRAIYEVLSNDSLKINLVPGENVNYQPVFNYKQSAFFDLIYDFELANNFVNIAGNANLQTTSTEGLVFEGDRSLTVVLNELNPSFKIVSADRLLVQVSSAFVIEELPVDGRKTYIEMHYKNDAILTVGLVTNSLGLPNFSSEILKIGPKKEWSKIYIPLNNVLSMNNIKDIRIYFEATLPETLESARFSWDNIKIIHELN